MIARMRPEFRACILLLLIVAVYFTLVFEFVAKYKSDKTIAAFMPYAITNGGLLAVWGVTLVFMAIAYCTKFVFAHRSSAILDRLVLDFREFFRPEILALRVSIFISWFLLMGAFTIFKVMIGAVHGFTLDPNIAAFERAALFGHDAWQYTHFLFGSPLPTFILQASYNAWFALMWGSILLCLLFVENVREILHYLLAFVLCWIIVGSLAAYFLASAGPCYYERILGDAHFHPLMLRLHEIDRSLGSIFPALQLTSLDVQDMLWGWQVERHDGLGAGISAMPSVHVGLAFVMARGAYFLRPIYGRIMSIYVGLVWIASVHLGWHYAVDGAVALLLAILIWKISGWLVGVCFDFRRQAVPLGAFAP